MGLYAVAATQLVFRLFHPIDRSNLDTFLQKRNSKERERGTINHDSVPRSRFGLPKTLQNSLVGLPISGLIRFVITERNFGAFLSLHFDRVIFF